MKDDCSGRLDKCGVCDGDNSTCLDCAGVANGTAVSDTCGTCVNGTTGLSACTQDCAGVWGGDTLTDECGVCDGSGKTTYYADTDGDGKGDPNSSKSSCTQPSGHVLTANDDDDTKYLSVVNPIADITVIEDAANLEIDISTVFSQASDELSYEVSPLDDFYERWFKASISGTTVSLEFTENTWGTDTLFIVASKGEHTVTELVTVTITPVNDAPTARPPSELIKNGNYTLTATDFGFRDVDNNDHISGMTFYPNYDGQKNTLQKIIIEGITGPGSLELDGVTISSFPTEVTQAQIDSNKLNYIAAGTGTLDITYNVNDGELTSSSTAKLKIHKFF